MNINKVNADETDNDLGEDLHNKDYVYLIKNHAVIEANMYDLFGSVKSGNIYIIGYHITRESKFPFIQILLEKNLGQLYLPKINILSTDERTIEDIVLNHVDTLLLSNYYDNRYQTNGLKYTGIITDNNENIYALVDVSCLKLNSLFLNTNDAIWFALPTEIINKGYLNSIAIHESVVELFVSMPELSILYYPDLKQVYILPDVVYGYPLDIKICEINSLIGVNKSKQYKSCGTFYFFYSSYDFVVSEFKKHKIKHTLDLDLDTNVKNINNIDTDIKEKDILYAINRFVIFAENYYNHIETNDELQLTDKDIWGKYKVSKCIYLRFITENLEYICEDSYKPNVLIKDYENYLPISFHYVV